MTPKKLAATIVAGTIVGVIPALGITTVLGTAIAARFRLNIAATVLVSYLAQPLQLLLVLPYIKLGILLLGLDELKLTFDEMQQMFRSDWVLALNQLWKANLAGVAAWLVTSVPAGAILYAILVPILKAVMPVPAALPISIPTDNPVTIPEDLLT